MVQGIRSGALSDVRALIRMHTLCSEETVLRRYLTPLPVLTTRLAARLLAPPGGFSVVAERPSAGIVGIVTVAPAADGVADAGALVADSWQRQGIGTQLLIVAAREAGRTFRELSLTSQPVNRAVLPTVYATGLRARVRQRDGLVEIRIPLVGIAPREDPVTSTPGATG